jgi:hypothetical protein
MTEQNKRWLYNTGDCLIEVTTCVGFIVICTLVDWVCLIGGKAWDARYKKISTSSKYIDGMLIKLIRNNHIYAYNNVRFEGWDRY